MCKNTITKKKQPISAQCKAYLAQKPTPLRVHPNNRNIKGGVPVTLGDFLSTAKRVY